MYERILGALKQDDSDAIVVGHAGNFAQLTGGGVTLVHVVHSHSLDESAYLEEQAEKYLAMWVDKLLAVGVSAAARVVQGEPADAIIGLARELSADLIIMATHGHSGVRHVLVGSVTEDVVRNVDVPVLLVQSQDE